MVPAAHGVRLGFDPNIETRIYRTIPHDLVRDLPRLALPRGFICGRESEEMRQAGPAATRKFFRVARIAGGPPLPFQLPEAAAPTIRPIAPQLLGSGWIARWRPPAPVATS